MYYTTIYASPIGIITLACDENNLVGLWVEGQKYHGGTIRESMVKDDNVSVFKPVIKWLDHYFSGENPSISGLPLAPIGSPFRQGVWGILREIPYGTVVTYGEIAKKMASMLGKKSMSSQAIGGAVGHNPISIIIPCHRVVGSNGSLTGYSAGIPIKIKLLELEGTDVSNLIVPKKGTAL